MKDNESNQLGWHFARFISRISRGGEPEVSLAAGLVSRQLAEGHICVNLKEYAGFPVDPEDPTGPAFPRLGLWREKLASAGIVGSPGDYTPLVLDDHNRLYLHRYWEYENQVVHFLKTRGREECSDGETLFLEGRLERYFGKFQEGNTNWQAVAAIIAVSRKFCVITGGPGTGKTTTVARILALILESDFGCRDPRIMLAAPTGKAAARLQQSLAWEKKKLDCPQKIKNALPDSAMTLHRLLGVKPHSPYFRYNESNRLPADLVVVDEASMVDLPLMAKLVRAIGDDCRLVLLGDRNQLASVEPGAVFADVCDQELVENFSATFCDNVANHTGMLLERAVEKVPPLCDSIVELKKSYRFEKGSGIEILSKSVNEGDCDKALEVLSNPSGVDIIWRELPPPEEMSPAIAARVRGREYDFLRNRNVMEAFQGFGRFMILCALRKGPYGVESINRIIYRTLKDVDMLSGSLPYRGEPVMVTENNYTMELFNGDMGILSPAEERNVAQASFRNSEGQLRTIPLYRMPVHEKAYAMTVHKSQGSEFDSIVLILPDTCTPVLTRELIYTALTRAKKKVEVWTTKEVFAWGVTETVKRDSGIHDLLFA